MPVSAEFRGKNFGERGQKSWGGAGKTPEKGGCKSPALLWVNVGAKYVGLGGRKRKREGAEGGETEGSFASNRSNLFPSKGKRWSFAGVARSDVIQEALGSLFISVFQMLNLFFKSFQI